MDATLILGGEFLLTVAGDGELTCDWKLEGVAALSLTPNNNGDTLGGGDFCGEGVDFGLGDGDFATCDEEAGLVEGVGVGLGLGLGILMAIATELLFASVASEPPELVYLLMRILYEPSQSYSVWLGFPILA